MINVSPEHNCAVSAQLLVASPNASKPLACLTCVQRKVKCDKQQPCHACTKSRLQCISRAAPSPPKRRRRTADVVRVSHERALADKIRQYEALLRNAGISLPAAETPAPAHQTDCACMAKGAQSCDHERMAPSGDEKRREMDRQALGEAAGTSALDATAGAVDPDPVPETATPVFPRHRGLLLSEYGGKRYYEHGLVGALGQKFKQPPPPPAGPSVDLSLADVNLLAGIPTAQHVLSELPPRARSVASCWTIYLSNVHPLTKVVHAPTVAPFMVDTHSPEAPLQEIDALKFAICSAAVASLTDDQSRTMFREPKSTILNRWQGLARQALQASSFTLVPKLDLTRAHLLLLTSMVGTAQPALLWTLMGVVMRMARSQGLHRDGTALGLPPFETEMRRRLWWYIVTFDGRLCELTGSESVLAPSTNTQLPANVDDCRLDPDMVDPPDDRPGASEMIFCLVKYETTSFLQRRDPRVDRAPCLSASPVLQPIETEPDVTKEKEGSRKISSLQARMENRFLRFCDPLTPLHLLTTTVARSLICKFRHMEQRGLAYQRRQQPFDPKSERDINRKILRLATRNVSYDNLIHSSPSLNPFLWHVHFYFPWGAPIFVLKILISSRSSAEWDEDMEAAWIQILELYRHHPEFLTLNRPSTEHLIVGDLVVKAWEVRESARAAAGLDQTLGVPSVIVNLREHFQHQRDAIADCNDGGGHGGDMGVIESLFIDEAFSGIEGGLDDWAAMNWSVYSS